MLIVFVERGAKIGQQYRPIGGIRRQRAESLAERRLGLERVSYLAAPPVAGAQRRSQTRQVGRPDRVHLPRRGHGSPGHGQRVVQILVIAGALKARAQGCAQVRDPPGKRRVSLWRGRHGSAEGVYGGVEVPRLRVVIEPGQVGGRQIGQPRYPRLITGRCRLHGRSAKLDGFGDVLAVPEPFGAYLQSAAEVAEDGCPERASATADRNAWRP